MSHIATAELSGEMQVVLQSDQLTIEDSPEITGGNIYVSFNKQQTLKLKDFLNREV
jgi:hypothetical protein